ncbi:Biotin transporter BioY [Pelotomaculum schinkii]|uniref:Biotin transporter n=1 Tax=Pelotomaculum schinkii TaxID=78350 RepID=A0A4Y7RJ51_9FIRM|nr:biotin transporter BioY [Pelotomaculum schinkii]TEB08357.1 Biotin transporter BioY [Pelotomaculum schinkii]
MSKLSARDITMTAVFAALAVVAAMLVRYAGSVVPFSLMPLMAMLAGGLLGPKLGALSMVVYILLGLTGAPVFATPPFGGPAYVLQPTFGFLPGFAGCAYVIGILLRNKEESGFLRYFLSMTAGIVVYYLVGLPYLYAILTFYIGKTVSVAQVLTIGFTPFIALDLVKAAMAAVLARAVSRRLKAYGMAGNK